MIEWYGPHITIVDGEVRHPDDLGPDDSSDEADFSELPVADQEAVIDVIDHISHHAVAEEALPTRGDASSTAIGLPESHQQPERHLPPTADELDRFFRAKKLARQVIDSARSSSDERERPYDELGGHAPQLSQTEVASEPLEIIVSEAQEWMRDVHDMLRYAIPELTPEAVQVMQRDDRKLLALHFQGLWDRIPTAERLISWGHGDVTTHPFLESRYGKRRSSDEMNDYVQRLAALGSYLEANKAAWLLRQVAYDGFRSKKERDSKYVRDRQKNGAIRVIRGEDGIYRTERMIPGAS